MSLDQKGKKKILITGGAGFLGFHLCHFLKNKDYEVTVFDLVDPNREEYPRGVNFIQGDVRKREDIRRAMKGVSLVIHGAAALPLWSRRDIFTTNVNGTVEVLEAAREAEIERVVFISSTAVYGIPKKHPIEENDPLVGVGPYGESKILAEKACLEFRDKGMIVPIIRPKTFIGSARLGVFYLLYDWVESGKRIPMIGNGKNKYQLLEVQDLCAAINLTLEAEDDKVNDNFNVGAEIFNTVREDLDELCQIAGNGARPMGTPAGIVKGVLRVLEFFNLSPLYTWVYGTADKDSFASIKKIKDTLGWRPRFSNSEALKHSYNWYLQNKDKISHGMAGVTHTVAWNQGILGFIKNFF